ncbi:MAG TPA: SufD family Fe-S cluster assembly protein [Nitrososphaeraceae archaeon]|nr:SufD family Fe-S cluster assembly protein [Nitrososphaeraceae archaeon]
MYQLSLLEKNFNNLIENVKEPSWMTQTRHEAFKQYTSLPLESSALYSKYSNANKLIPDNIFFNSPTLTDDKDELNIFSDRIEELSKTSSILCKNSKILQSFLPEEFEKKGIIITNITYAINEFSDLIQKYLNKNKLNYEEDKFLALSSAAFQNGYFIFIPKNIVLEDPIRIINYLSEDGLSSISRNIIVCEDFSKATLVQELYSPEVNNSQSQQQAYFELLEAHVMPNAQCEMVTLQSMNYDSINFSNRKAFVERDAKMSWSLALFGSQLSRYKVDSIMQGPGALAEDVEIIFGIGNQSFDITSNLIHVAPHTRGKVLVKSVLKDTSQSLFKGMIKINKNAKATESYLAGHAILLNKGAKSDAIPGLEIECNEVRATHSASVAQIDENQIFYLMSRGLSKELAKREIVGGFLEPISRKMGPTIRAWINYLIENKWLGKPLKLKIDEAMEQILEVEKSRYRENEDIFEKHYKYR